jgi:hypothetical protein
MPIYLCHEGHKHRSQDGATNCGYCKRNVRRTPVRHWLTTDAVKIVKCPKCNQPRRHQCLTPKGRKAWPPHSERVSALLKHRPIELYQAQAISLPEFIKTIKV